MDHTTLASLMNTGGVIMWPLYMLLVTMIVIIIERIVTIIGVSREQQPVSKERLERPLSILDLIAMIAPVTGFLGTVTGMINAFKAVADAASVQLQTVASGLYEALFTTAFGLIISLLATVAGFFLEYAIESVCEKEKS